MIDADNWRQTSIDEVVSIFSGAGVSWWIAGGWALDLFLGRITRDHKDIDVQILRRDQLAIQRHLADWKLFKTNQPGLEPWPQGEMLEPPVNSVWARENDDSRWALDIKLMETEGDCWVYRRDPRIRGKIRQLGLRTGTGIPYIAPEVQLLFKSAGTDEKDLADLDVTLPMLSRDKVEWLLDCLRLQYQSGHEWIDRIEYWSNKA